MKSWMEAAFRRWSVVRFSVVGALCATLNLAIQAVAVGLFHAHYLFANAISFLVLVPVSFFLHRAVTFARKGDGWPHDLLRYTAHWLAIFLLNIALMLVLVEGLNVESLAAVFVATGLVYALNYLGQRFWIFRNPTEDDWSLRRRQ